MSMSRTIRRRAERTRRPLGNPLQIWKIPTDPALGAPTCEVVPGSERWTAAERDAYARQWRASFRAAGGQDLTAAAHAAAARYGEVAEA